jgi:predicted SnoaL-like aldol condensation-catalyzing enzyme
MLLADHPNALWLTGLYGGGTDTADAEVVAALLPRLSPDFVIHTRGVRLATTGGLDFVQTYARRRAELAAPVPVEIYQILADDSFAFVYAKFRLERDGAVWETPGMGVWRFEDGLAVEHWEVPDGRRWDAFYLEAVAAQLQTATDYWSRS